MPARVLVVDDMPANVELLSAKLSAEYYDVFAAADGEAALSLVREAGPDIVLLDVMMPGMDGFEVCRRIKQDPETAHIPVVMITALSDVGDRVRGLEAGADDFLTKPVRDQALFTRIKSLLRLKSVIDELRLRDLTGRQLGVMPRRALLSPDDVGGARVLLVDDNRLSREDLATLATQAGYAVTPAKSSAEAQDLAAVDDFDLIVVSLQMGGDDALRLCSRVRSAEETRHTPILLIIEERDSDQLAKGLELGINDYVVRPVDHQELFARMRTQVRRKRYQDGLRAGYRHSLSLALTDSLTELYNRRYFDAHFGAQLARAADEAKPLALLMIDIDHFKKVNDAHGHGAGDEVLRETARLIAANVRSFDTVARLGGEEFAVVMPDTDAENALAVAKRLLGAVAEEPLRVAAAPDAILRVTVSLGLAVATRPVAAAELLERADAALYAAKRGGRNRIYQAMDGREPNPVPSAATASR